MTRIPRFVAPLTARDALAALFPAGSAADPVARFAERFAAYIGTACAVPAPSARVALGAVLHALDLAPGGEVILPALTFHSVPAAIRESGLVPRFADIGADSYVLNPAQIERVAGPRTVAIVPTHLYGRACDMDAILSMARDRGWKVIEDCAQSAGGHYAGRKLGGLGDAAIFSFGPTKNLSALWAGMVTTNSREIAERATAYMARLQPLTRSALTRRLVFALGMRFATRPVVWSLLMVPMLRLLSSGSDPIERLTTETPGESGSADREASRMPRPYQGRAALIQLGRLDESNRARIANGERLRRALADADGVVVPAAARDGENIYMSFPCRFADRDAVRRRLFSLGVDTAVGYMSVGPELPGLADSGEGAEAARAVREMLHLPVYPDLSADAVDRIAEAVRRAVRG